MCEKRKHIENAIREWDTAQGSLNLRLWDLKEADLTEADLTEADLTEADLTGADLSGAELMDATPPNGYLFIASGGEKENHIH